MTPAQNRNQRTGRVTLDTEAFKGIGTLSHQLYYPSKIPLVDRRECEPSEVKTIRQIQSRWAMFPIPSITLKPRDPVSTGGGKRPMACGLWGVSSFPGVRSRLDKTGSSSRGEERTKLKICEHVRKPKCTCNNLRVGERL